MTIVLGRNDVAEVEPDAKPDRLGIRRDLTWEQRRRQYHAAHTPGVYPTWQPDSAPAAPEPELDPDSETKSLEDPVRPGLLWLYAARIAHARLDPSTVRRTSAGDRILVGDDAGDEDSVRSMAVIGAVEPIGRGHVAHYQRLYPTLDARLHGAAEIQISAHLIKLREEGRVD